MQQRKNILFHNLLPLAMIVISLFSSCNSRKNEFNFKDAKEAVNACRRELSEIRKLKEPSIKEVTEKVARWVVLQDTTFSMIMRDSTIDYNSRIAIDFFIVADSVRDEVVRAALEKKRSMKDIWYMKVHTARDREKTQKSEDYKLALIFFEDVDKQPLFKDLQTTMKEYENILKETSSFKKEKEMRDFIKKEDKCFRSLMQFLPDVRQDELDFITRKTTNLFESLYKTAAITPENEVNNRVMIYLSMRFNRRVVQNALAVQRDIDKNIELDEQQRITYKLMILQPFLSIDSYSLASLTTEQDKEITQIAEKLPQTLAALDGKDYDKSPKEETDKLASVLTEYFIRMHFQNSL